MSNEAHVCFAAFLIKFLERRCCECNFDGEDLSFVYKSLQDTGITLPRLHEMYDRLFKTKVSDNIIWASLRLRLVVIFYGPL